MPTITLKTRSGKYLSLAATGGLPAVESPFEEPAKPEPLRVVVETSERPTPFFLEERGDGKCVLRDAFAGYFLSAENGGGGKLVAMSEDGPGQAFTRISQSEDGREVALLAADGRHYVSETGDELVVNAMAVGPSEVLVAETIPVLRRSAPHDPDHHHGCCGPAPRVLELESADTPGAGILWDDKSHEGLLRRAIALVAGYRQPPPAVQQFLEIWRNIPQSPKYQFAAGQAFQGLYDADHLPRFTDPWFARNSRVPPSYRTHFYNPEVRENYLHKLQNPVIAAIAAGLTLRGTKALTHCTAMTEGQRYFNLAVHHGRRVVRFGSARSVEDMRKLGYYLGLSLHFLTDLTQSMHADNFTAVDLKDTWPVNFHGALESWLDEFPQGGSWNDSVAAKFISQATIDAKDLTYWQDHSHTSMGVLLHVLADYSRKQLSRLGDSPPRPLTVEYAKDYLTHTLQEAPRWVVRLLMAWMHCSNQELGLSDQVWYRIVEMTKGEPLRSRSDYLVRGSADVPEDDRLFCVLFNRDGTCSFVLKADMSKVWALHSELTGWAFRLKRETPGKPETSFRVVPGLKGRMWIYQSDEDEAVTIWEGGTWDGFSCRWPPLHGLSEGVGGYQKTGQVFKFEVARSISTEEQQILKARQPDWGKYPWWGAP